jgi:hypothetical protein
VAYIRPPATRLIRPAPTLNRRDEMEGNRARTTRRGCQNGTGVQTCHCVIICSGRRKIEAEGTPHTRASLSFDLALRARKVRSADRSTTWQAPRRSLYGRLLAGYLRFMVVVLRIVAGAALGVAAVVVTSFAVLFIRRL